MVESQTSMRYPYLTGDKDVTTNSHVSNVHDFISASTKAVTIKLDRMKDKHTD